MKIAADQLRSLATTLLESRDVSPDAAVLQADLLVEAELRGQPSHGLQRLPLCSRDWRKGSRMGTPREPRRGCAKRF